ncbi:MAG: hypothetical protein E7180_01355 [Erysipelotrichaceae bacterium]|nr:hypothetical protein [Erysipelotrichaceae bacterium]
MYNGNELNTKRKASAHAKKRRRTSIIAVFVLLFALITSGYYLYNTVLLDNAYKVFVEGGTGSVSVSNDSNELQLKGSEDGNPTNFLSGRGNTNPIGGNGGSIAQTPVEYTDQDTGETRVYTNMLDYIMSVGSNQEDTVKTDKPKKDQTSSANGDQFLAGKFYLYNNNEGSTEDVSLKKNRVDNLTSQKETFTVDGVEYEVGTVFFAVKLTITRHAQGALEACRFALMEVHDEENIFNVEGRHYDQTGESFTIDVFAQPKSIVQENGDKLIYQGHEEDSQEYVATTASGTYTNEEDVPLMKNPNKGKQDEDWKCTNLHFNNKNNTWEYDSLVHENKVYSIPPHTEVPYVIAAWYEGSDPNHNNDIKGGFVSFQFSFYPVLPHGSQLGK